VATEAATIAAKIERLAREALARLEGLPEEALNHKLALPETNSLYALATHMLGAGQYWTVTLVGGHDIPRNREAEFAAMGTLPLLRERYESWLAVLHEDLDALPDAEMNRLVTLTGRIRPDWMESDQITARESLLHALEHTALHVGHIQLTRQLLQDTSAQG
jgi:hypothetical protein